jgi:hypothetical protein
VASHQVGVTPTWGWPPDQDFRKMTIFPKIRIFSKILDFPDFLDFLMPDHT